MRAGGKRLPEETQDGIQALPDLRGDRECPGLAAGGTYRRCQIRRLSSRVGAFGRCDLEMPGQAVQGSLERALRHQGPGSGAGPVRMNDLQRTNADGFLPDRCDRRRRGTRRG